MSNPRVLARLTLAAVVLLTGALAALRLVPGSPFGPAAAAPGERRPAAIATSPEALTSPSAGPIGTPSPIGTSSPTGTPSPTAPPLPVAPVNVQISAVGWWSWAMQDTRTGKIYGSANLAETNTTASLIKSWIGADFLRRSTEQHATVSGSRLDEISSMIRDSDNDAAQDLWVAVGESDSIGRLISICKLTDSSAYKNLWSNTRLSARDITRLGACIADGRAAGPKWTTYLLNEMRSVHGDGDFGIRKAFPAAEQKTIAIKNGWVDRPETQEYHVSCLAIGDGWTVGVMARYPINLDYPYGATICESVGRQLLAATK